MNNTTLIIVAVAALAAAVLLWLLLRSGRRAANRPPVLSERSGDERPYVRKPESADHGAGLADEVATATTDVVADVLHVERERRAEGADNLERLKGVGPKLAGQLNALGISTYQQLAGLNENEVRMLDERLGAFKGRIARDRLVEQADYLARGDTDGFEERFGKLGG